MRRLCLAIVLALSFVPVVNAQILPASEGVPDGGSKTAYFVIDSSASMEGFQDAADQAAQRKLSEYGVNPPTASYTYFQSCRAKIKISEPGARPTRPAADGGTPLGAALAAVLDRAGSGPADIFILTDATQTESCGPDICLVARDQLPKPNIAVMLVPINADRQNIDRLACIEGAQFGSALATTQPLEVLSPVESQTAELEQSQELPIPGKPPVTRRGKPLPIVESLPWSILALLFALSFYLFGQRFGASAQCIQKEIEQIQYNSNSPLPRPKCTLPLFLFVSAIAFSLVVLWAPWGALDFARSGANDVLNTQFGSSVFLAALLMLAGFAGSQYWRYVELRRAYSVASKERERDKKAREFELERRMLAKEENAARQRHESYIRARSSLSGRDYRLNRYLKRGDKYEENADLLERVVAAVKSLVLGAESTQDKLNEEQLSRVRKLNRFNASFEDLIDALPNQLESVAATIKDFLNPGEPQSADDQNSQLAALVDKLEQAAIEDNHP